MFDGWSIHRHNWRVVIVGGCSPDLLDATTIEGGGTVFPVLFSGVHVVDLVDVFGGSHDANANATSYGGWVRAEAAAYCMGPLVYLNRQAAGTFQLRQLPNTR